jgi:putative ABC transport system ATP-binding protein
VELSMRFSRVSKKERQERARNLLEELGLGDRSEVDSKTRDSIVRILKELSEKGQTILVVTHDPEVAKECSKVLRITDGMINDNQITEQLN